MVLAHVLVLVDISIYKQRCARKCNDCIAHTSCASLGKKKFDGYQNVSCSACGATRCACFWSPRGVSRVKRQFGASIMLQSCAAHIIRTRFVTTQRSLFSATRALLPADNGVLRCSRMVGAKRRCKASTCIHALARQWSGEIPKDESAKN